MTATLGLICVLISRSASRSISWLWMYCWSWSLILSCDLWFGLSSLHSCFKLIKSVFNLRQQLNKFTVICWIDGLALGLILGFWILLLLIAGKAWIMLLKFVMQLHINFAKSNFLIRTIFQFIIIVSIISVPVFWVNCSLSSIRVLDNHTRWTAASLAWSTQASRILSYAEVILFLAHRIT